MLIQILALIASLFMTPAPGEMVVKSPAFAHGHYIPVDYTCQGENINPGLFVEGIPDNTKSFVLIMTDTSEAFGTFDHWIVWNIPANGLIKENSSPGVTGLNSRKEAKYTGPCPPNGIHEYRFKMYALSTMLSIPADSDKQILLRAMDRYIVGEGELIGLFQK